jgi:ArsR family transcriptional regulator, arsenate/arsenite/antimonite-responsive transcriptional repressor
MAGRLTLEEAAQLATLFRVLGEPMRLHMLSLIAAQPDREVCACELAAPLGLSQPTVSHHLKVMYEAGLLARERRKTWIFYRIVPEKLAMLRASLDKLYGIVNGSTTWSNRLPKSVEYHAP